MNSALSNGQHKVCPSLVQPKRAPDSTHPVDNLGKKMVRTKNNDGRANAGRRPTPRVDADDSSNNSNNNAKDEDNEWETARDIALIFLEGRGPRLCRHSKVRITLGTKRCHSNILLVKFVTQYIAQLKLAAVLNRYAPYADSPTLIITKRKHITHL